MSEMKILYVDCQVLALNPTNTLQPALIAAAGKTTFYGPGSVLAGDLQGGILRFMEKKGPFDVVVIGPNVPALSKDEAEMKSVTGYLQRYAGMAPPESAVRDFYVDLWRSLPDLPCRFKFLSLLNFDYYATTQTQIQRLDALDLHVIAPNADFVLRLEDLPDWVRTEKHFKRKAERLSNAWYDFVSRRPERIVTAVHFVGDTEFSFRGLSERRLNISVPGVEYVLRDRAIKALAAAGIKPNRKFAFRLFLLLNKLGFGVFRNYVPLKLFNLLFVQDLMESRFVYTARGGFGIPIRKFFEIPAAGATMICSPPLGFRALGFVDGVHYVEAAPEDLPAVLRELEAQPDRAQDIASNGRQLVFERHSLQARARQISSCFEAICGGHYRGSAWVDGEFVVRSSRDEMVRDEAALTRA